MRAAFVITLALAAAGSVSARQAPTGPPKPEALSAPVAILLTNGWASLAEGKFDVARQRVSDVWIASPQSVLGLTLAIEIDIAQKDSNAALTTYETWLGRRTIEEPFMLRRIARAALFEASRLGNAPPGTRLAALRSLADEGDAEAREALEGPAFRVPGSIGAIPETQILASMGDSRAVAEAIKYLGTEIPGKRNMMEALADSRHLESVPALLRMLKDPNPDNRAGAAEALGRLDARAAVTELRALFASPNSTIQVRMAAAGALYRMGDNTGQAQLRTWLTTGPPGARAEAARVMAGQPDQEWQNAVRQIVASNEPTAQLAGARLIAPYDLALATDTVSKLMGSPNVVVREQAGQIMAKQLATDFRVLRALIRAEDPGTRIAAAARVMELTR